jgi:Zn-dependent M28 family amino/carboxypeptidase
MTRHHNNLIYIALIALVCLGPGPSYAVEEVRDPASVIELGKYQNQAMDHLDRLTNDIGPRLAGSDNHREACNWARDQFERFGLKNAHLEVAAEVPVGFERGRSTGFIKSPLSMELHFTTPAWTPGTNGKRRARAVMAPETVESLERSRAALEGAWVLWRPKEKWEDGEEYTRKWNEMKLEVAGVITPSKGELIHTSGNHRVDWDNLPTTPTVNLLESEWNRIAGILADGRDVTLEFDIRNKFKKGPVEVHNVVADIPGSEKPDEYVIIGAHIDSHDSGTGAMDNGTGVAAAMEAARILVESGGRPKRTIRFVLFGGEELGILGANGYVESHPELMPKISAMYNMDMGADYVSGILATDAMLDDFEVVFGPVMSLNPEMAFEIERVEHLPRAMTDCGEAAAPTSPLIPGGCGGRPRIKRKIVGEPGEAGEAGESGVGVTGCGGTTVPDTIEVTSSCGGTVGIGPDKRLVVLSAGSSDHAPFLAAGVPAFMWRQKGKNPVPYYLHTQKDTYEHVVPEYLEHSAVIIALAALGTANLDHMLSRESLVEETLSAE